MMYTYIILLVALLQTSKANIECDKLGLHLYKDIGCVKKENPNGCPSFEDCKFERPQGKCLYKGLEFQDTQSISSKVNDTNCNFGCFCSAESGKKGEIICAQGSCGTWGGRMRPGCYLQYTLDSCCSTKTLCEVLPPAITCRVDGKIYKEGERFFPKDTCLTCICTSDFNGEFENRPYCINRPCGVEIRHADDLENNCAPVYFKRQDEQALCCPDTFICPASDDVISEEKVTENGKICKYGKQEIKQGKKLSRVVNQFGKNRTVSCECLSPPWLSCITEY